MRAGGGKNKGSTFERQIANYLSERFKEYTGIDKSFRRNSDSGSFFGGSNQSRVNTHSAAHQNFGDILSPEDFRWNIECKCYKDPFSLNSILLQKNKILDDWLCQAEQDAGYAGRAPLLIIKFNNCEIFVMTKNIDSNAKFYYKEYRAYLLDHFFSGPDVSFFSTPV